jgi:hypothetical protein
MSDRETLQSLVAALTAAGLDTMPGDTMADVRAAVEEARATLDDETAERFDAKDKELFPALCDEAAERFDAANYGESADPKPAHTPGPWKLIPHPDNSDMKSDFDVVDEHSKWQVGVAFGEPDARLIIAAPALADECRHTLRNLESMLRMLPVNAPAVERQSLAAWAERNRAVLARIEGSAAQ